MRKWKLINKNDIYMTAEFKNNDNGEKIALDFLYLNPFPKLSRKEVINGLTDEIIDSIYNHQFKANTLYIVETRDLKQFIDWFITQRRDLDDKFYKFVENLINRYEGKFLKNYIEKEFDIIVEDFACWKSKNNKLYYIYLKY